MNSKSNSNDEAWDKIFRKHDIVNRVANDGYVNINAKDIKVFREPRLMAKFDHSAQLPKLFRDNNLTILPISRSGYIIGGFKAYHTFESHDDAPIERVSAPTFLESLDFSSISSESSAINCVYVSKILNKFTGEEELYPTVNGRMRSGNFNFNINALGDSLKINVNNSQIEIDGGFEGLTSLTLLEAKNYIADDFIVRQLFYPYRLWASKIQKAVRPVFLSYTNGIFHLREYTFDDADNYNSIRLLRQCSYSTQQDVINAETIMGIMNRTPISPEPAIPFPQADKFDRVINLGELLLEHGKMTKDAITRNYLFDERQTEYYFNALKYLGFAEKISIDGKKLILLSNRGRMVYNMDINSRQIEFITAILAHRAFRETLELYFKQGVLPSKDEIIEIMHKSGLHKVGEQSTYRRRSSTISGWVNWIVSLMEE